MFLIKIMLYHPRYKTERVTVCVLDGRQVFRNEIRYLRFSEKFYKPYSTNLYLRLTDFVLKGLRFFTDLVLKGLDLKFDVKGFRAIVTYVVTTNSGPLWEISKLSSEFKDRHIGIRFSSIYLPVSKRVVTTLHSF